MFNIKKNKILKLEHDLDIAYDTICRKDREKKHIKIQKDKEIEFLEEQIERLKKRLKNNMSTSTKSKRP